MTKLAFLQINRPGESRGRFFFRIAKNFRILTAPKWSGAALFDVSVEKECDELKRALFAAKAKGYGVKIRYAAEVVR